MNESNESNEECRVLMFHPALAPYRVGLFNALFKGCCLELVLLTKNNANQNFDQSYLLQKLTCRPSYLDSGVSLYGRGVPKGIRAKIGMFNPSVVITTEFSITSYVVAACNFFSGNKFAHVIWTDDNKELICGDAFHRRLSRKIFSRLADGWFFISTEVAEYYESVVGIKGKSALIPVIHDDDDFIVQLSRTDKLRNKYIEDNDLEGRNVVLFVGRLVEEKGIDELIFSFKKVVERLSDSVLVIVGDGEQLDYLKNLSVDIEMDSSIRFVGRYEGDELIAWYRTASVFALASRYEPFGAVVNEALISGVPVVVSSRVGARSLVVEGVNGSVVDIVNGGSFSDSLIAWLNKSGPISKGDVLGKNLMTFKFSEMVTEALKALKALAAK